jgi:hypothetical protein
MLCSHMNPSQVNVDTTLYGYGITERLSFGCFTKANTYGKTFHTWQVDRGDVLPLGPPQLMMSATADGQVQPTLHVHHFTCN